MAEQVYCKAFYTTRYLTYESENDAREKALEGVNEFLFKHDDICVINISEEWTQNRSYLKLVVYYKNYI